MTISNNKKPVDQPALGGKCMKFCGPGGIRTLDLFSAIDEQVGEKGGKAVYYVYFVPKSPYCASISVPELFPQYEARKGDTLPCPEGEIRNISPFLTFLSVDRLKHSTKGLKGQIVKNSVGNQGLAVLFQSIGWVERKVSWLPLVTFFKVQSTFNPTYLLTFKHYLFSAFDPNCTISINP